MFRYFNRKQNKIPHTKKETHYLVCMLAKVCLAVELCVSVWVNIYGYNYPLLHSC